MSRFRIRKILRSALIPAIALLLMVGCGLSLNVSSTPSFSTTTTATTRSLSNCRVNTKRFYQLDDDGALSATITSYGDMRLTAAHAAMMMRNASDWLYWGRRDLATIGGTDCPVGRPGWMQPVVYRGYPAGSLHETVCRGHVMAQQPDGEWFVKINRDCPPVVPGMSGGAVVDIRGRLLGIIVSTNSPTDIDGDGRIDESFNFEYVLDK